MTLNNFKGNSIIKFLSMITIILYSCTDKDSHKSTTYIFNDSGSKIEFAIFRTGAKVEYQTRIINVNEKVSIFTSTESPGTSYPASLGDIYDSLLVLFDNNKVATHYYYGVVGNNPNAVLFTNSRNLFNEKNYEHKIIKDNKRDFEQEFLYTITEQDYINAVSN